MTKTSNTTTTDSGIIVHRVDPKRIERAAKLVEADERKIEELGSIRRQLNEELSDPDPRVAALAQLALSGAMTSDTETGSTGVAIKRLEAAQKAYETHYASLEKLQTAGPGSAVAAAEALAEMVGQYEGVQLHAAAIEEPSGLTGPRLVVVSKGSKELASGVASQSEDLEIVFTAPSYWAPLNEHVVMDTLHRNGFAFATAYGTKPTPLSNELEAPINNVSISSTELVQRIGWNLGVRFNPRKAAKR